MFGTNVPHGDLSFLGTKGLGHEKSGNIGDMFILIIIIVMIIVRSHNLVK